jgi:hypothetical protein
VETAALVADVRNCVVVDRLAHFSKLIQRDGSLLDQPASINQRYLELADLCFMTSVFAQDTEYFLQSDVRSPMNFEPALNNAGFLLAPFRSLVCSRAGKSCAETDAAA